MTFQPLNQSIRIDNRRRKFLQDIRICLHLRIEVAGDIR